MIVCHRYRFIFVTTRKTGGERIEAALARFCSDDDIVTGVSVTNELTQARVVTGRRGTVALSRYRPADWFRLFVGGEPARLDKHMSAAEIRNLVGQEMWSTYFKFCVERDPWDKAVALYEQRTCDRKPRPSLAQFLAETRRESLSNFGLYSIDGALAMDRVIRYEHLHSELDAMCNLLNLPTPIRLDAAPAPPPHYSRTVGQLERSLIDAACAREIEVLGYAFSEVPPEDR